MHLPIFLLSLLAYGLCQQATPTPGTSESPQPSQVISAAWYAGWHAADFPLSRVSWSKYTHITYAFAIVTDGAGFVSLDVSDETRLQEFVALAHANNTKASLSVGGWTGSRYFSYAVGSPSNRTTFVNSIVELALTYQLDGIDFDWEYPGLQGMGCNVVSPDDTANLLAFLQELRETATGKDLILSAAVYVETFTDETGQPSKDVSGFADVLDYIAVMNYDLKTTEAMGAAPRAPMNDQCAPEGARRGSAVTSIAAWNAAGIPMNQLVLGVPAYAHSFDVTPSAAISSADASRLNSYPPFVLENRKRGDRWDGEGGEDVCGVIWGPGGVFTYWGMIEEGFLDSDGAVRPSILSMYDDCSETPFAYNATSQVYVSYENARSFAAKGDFIHSNGLAGFAIWEAGGDYEDTLLDSIRNASVHGNPSVRSNLGLEIGRVPAAQAGEPTVNLGSPESPSSRNTSPAVWVTFLSAILLFYMDR